MNHSASTDSVPGRRRAPVLNLGFVPLVDCAPLAAASARGIFRAHGLKVRLHRQPGWASIRDGLIAGNMDAAHAPATLAFGTDLPGMFSIGLLLNAQGNAITLSRALHERGVRDAADLVSECRSRRLTDPVTFAAVARFSMHTVLLRQWLATAGIDPDKDVRIVTLPPRQMNACLAAGHIDGFCAGEPWNSLAADTGIGWTVATSADIAPGHPEKGLLVTRDCAENRREQYLNLIRALSAACLWCDTDEGRAQLPEILARPEWLDLPERIIRPALQAPGFVTFHRGGVSEPSPDKAAWLLAALRSQHLLRSPAVEEKSARPAFDHAAWQEALAA